MGVWSVDNLVIYNEAGNIDALINWLKRECDAKLIEVRREYHTTFFFIEGEGIPEGDFKLFLEEIIKGVVTVTIE